MTTTDPAAHADDDDTRRHPHGPDCGCDACAETLDDDMLVDDDGPDPEDDEPAALNVARAIVGLAVTALVLLAATFTLTLAAVWTTGTTSDNLGLSALTCAAGFGVALMLVGTAPRVLR